MQTDTFRSIVSDNNIENIQDKKKQKIIAYLYCMPRCDIVKKHL